MERLSEKEWKVFPAFGENGLLHIATTSSSIDGIKLKDGATKLVPYITRSDANNGVARFVSDANYEFGSDDAGCITVGLDTQTAFYQPHRFVTGQNIQVITGEKLDENTAQFLVATLKEQMKAKFNWGGNGATLGRMKRLEVMLPVDDKGNPDYAYMTLYSTELRGGMLMRYKNFIAGQLSQLEHKDIPALDEKEWGEFFIGDLFTVSRPKARNKDDYDFGDIPFVASGAVNNGVMKCCNAKPDESLDKGNCITVSPVDGSTFYQPMDFLGRGGAGSSILMLCSDWLNLYLGQFVARAVQQTCSKYTYGHMGNKDSIKRERIMLPVTDEGKPDYEYMEQYAKNMMLRKYEQYLAFIESGR